MQKSQKEALYLILSILIITIASGSYLIFGNLPQKQMTGQYQKTNLLRDAVKAVRSAENLTTVSATNKAQHAINQLKGSQKKQKLQKRLDVVKAQLEQEEAATQAVKSAEETPDQSLKDLAQKAVNELSNKGKKAALQARLDAIFIAKEMPQQVVEAGDINTWHAIPAENDADKDSSSSSVPESNSSSEPTTPSSSQEPSKPEASQSPPNTSSSLPTLPTEPKNSQ
ncbi:GA-like domain-containing protein [Streptococcus castoreus]|uniref:GA-like domain-containing protein n=1 Tax=Streptococcus castoreus TaxID=254786 RepID=UPI00041769AB|nr:fibrinogen-binding protein [Streptococcus castoreus]